MHNPTETVHPFRSILSTSGEDFSEGIHPDRRRWITGLFHGIFGLLTYKEVAMPRERLPIRKIHRRAAGPLGGPGVHPPRQQQPSASHENRPLCSAGQPRRPRSPPAPQAGAQLHPGASPWRVDLPSSYISWCWDPPVQEKATWPACARHGCALGQAACRQGFSVRYHRNLPPAARDHALPTSMDPSQRSWPASLGCRR